MKNTDRRTPLKKLNTLLFGKDLRITKGDVYSEVRLFDYASYFPKERYIGAQAPPQDNVYDIRFFGAATNRENNADAINAAIRMAGETHGTVLVSGGEYITQEVRLLSDVTLFIAADASLAANVRGEGYPHGAIVYADGASNIVVTGGGTVNGRGEYFGLAPKRDSNMTQHPEVIDVVQMRRDYRAQIRFAHPRKYGSPVYLKNCRSIIVNNFMVEASASWSLRLENCIDVGISNFVIYNNRNVANADGIDISGSSDVDIQHCFIATADDGICLKNAVWLGNHGTMEHICIADCEIISRTNAVKIGTETTYDIQDVTVENCSFSMPDVYPGGVCGIAVESADGAVVSDVTVRNIQMQNVTCPLFIRLCNRNRAAKVNAASANAVEFGKRVKHKPSAAADTFNMRGEVNRLIVENVTAKDVELPVIIAGFTQNKTTKYVNDITLRNITLRYAPYKEVYDRRAYIPEYSDKYPESWRFRNLPAYALWARHVKGLKLLDFNCSVPKSTWKEAIITEDVI